MTRPLYEPSEQREIAASQFASQQLFRRPAPSGACNFPWARISKGFDASNQTINNTTNTDLTANHTYNMGTGESGEGVFEVYTAGGNDIGISILVHGLYIFTTEVYWNTNPTTPWMFAITTPAPANDWFHGNYFGGQNTQDQFGLLSLTMRVDPTATDTYVSTVWHASGGSRLVDAYYLEIVQLCGDYTGTERQDMLPNQ